jgi:hypothetical protein
MSVIFWFLTFRVTANYQQVRTKRVNRAQYVTDPAWFVNRKSRLRDEGLTADNEAFVQEVIQDTYQQDSVMKRDSDSLPRSEYKKK